MPDTRYFCKKNEMTITGKLNKVAAAVIGPRSKLYAVKNSDNATGTVFAELLVSRSASKKSFHANKKVKIPVEMIPGMVIGRMIFRKLTIGEAPSIEAASSISIGTALKKLIIIHSTNGILTAAYTTTRAGK
ncbi:hypothetical protein D3C77_404960 [compost metagenome]